MTDDQLTKELARLSREAKLLRTRIERVFEEARALLDEAERRGL